MFPNLRLMVVAVLASILGISCALGLFAEFRVSHDSFLRELNASTPLQLGSSDAAPPGRVVNTAAPFEFRFQAPPPPAASKPSVVLKRQIALRSFKRCSLPMRLRRSLTSGKSRGRCERPCNGIGYYGRTRARAGFLRSCDRDAGSRRDRLNCRPNGQSEAPQDGRQNAKPGAEGDLAARTPAVPSPDEPAPKSEIAPASPSAARRSAGG